MTLTIDTRMARRLALAKGGLLKPEWSGLPNRAGRSAQQQRAAAHAVVRQFGYLQLDTVSIAGARSHALILLSRLEGFRAALGEQLLQPGEPLFEYWGHEASWIPMELYPLFRFRRRGIRRGDWWKRAMNGKRALAREVMRRIRDEGPVRSADLEGQDGGGWWTHKPAKKVVVALWSSGDLAVRERTNFQRSFDLPERVIPGRLLNSSVPRQQAIRELIRIALDSHGWATTGTLAATWRFRNLKPVIERALNDLVHAGKVLPCGLMNGDGRVLRGWIQPSDLDLAARLERLRPRRDRAVLLSPFDPVLWDRKRVAHLFDFDQVLEIFKPAAERRYGYFCLPVLAGDRLMARVDLKAERAQGLLRVLSTRFESSGSREPGSNEEQQALQHALQRYAQALDAVLAERP